MSDEKKNTNMMS